MTPAGVDGPRELERDLIRQLREEAYAVRDCFTRYSHQALVVSTTGLGLIAHAQIDTPYLGLLAVLPILLLFSVAGMGMNKYSTSNRLLGYELHLERTRRYSNWPSQMTDLGWEEAMRAWRIVSATLFEHIYAARHTGPGAPSCQRRVDQFTGGFRREQVRLRPPSTRQEHTEGPSQQEGTESTPVTRPGQWFEPLSLLGGDGSNVLRRWVSPDDVHGAHRGHRGEPDCYGDRCAEHLAR